MNLLTISRDELLENLDAKYRAWELARQEWAEAEKLLAEKDRLDALSAQFGNITEQDIQHIREAQVLSAQGISSEEVVKLN